MSVYVRRFLFDPGVDVLLEIESVNIIDAEPPGAVQGSGSGLVLLVGEFEDGPFAEPVKISGPSDLVSVFGELGYRRNGLPGFFPSAVLRKADNAVDPETWNGNAFVQMSGKGFGSLACVRVDTSVGAVTFRRRAFLTGGASFSYDLEPGQTLSLVDQVGTIATATFNAAAGVYTSGAGTYPVAPAAGANLILGFDGSPDLTVGIAQTDVTQAQVISRINTAFGFEFATSASPTTIAFTGRKKGKDGEVRIVGGTPALLSALGMVVTTAVGTGNVSSIDAVRFDEVKAIVEAAANWVTVEQDSGAALRISNTSTDPDASITVGAQTALNLGFVDGAHATRDGQARLVSAAGTYPTTFAGGETLTLQIDDEPNTLVTFLDADESQAQVISRINTALGRVLASSASATRLRLKSAKNGGTVRVVAGSTGVLAKLGLTAGALSGQAVTAVSIPAGTQVANTAGTRQLVTMQSTSLRATESGPVSVRVRHAIDDGTGIAFAPGDVTKVVLASDGVSLAVENTGTVVAALTEGAIDAAYATALDSTLDASAVSSKASLVWSARQSNAIRRKLRENAKRASESGLSGRMAAVRPPLGTPKAVALGPSEPGVTATRDQRVIYNYPGVQMPVPQIAQRGVDGGPGFTANGIVDVGSDGVMVSVCSQLPPEENPGQVTPFTGNVVALESRAPKLEMDDYTDFRAAGIAAPRMDDGVMVFQSGVTSANPTTNPGLRNIARRRMGDFVQDSAARRFKGFGKKLATVMRRRAAEMELRVFLDGLLSPTNPNQQRIAGYTIDTKTGNTPELLARGLWRILAPVRILPSLDSIVLQMTVGELVQVEVLFPESMAA